MNWGDMKMDKCTVKAAAKINLMLDIVAQRLDGYHDLFMVMQSVSLYDEITVQRVQGGGIVLTCSEPTLPTDEKNIAYKAALAFFEKTAVENTGVAIHVKKNIPFAAGLAGGSADGAGVIVALNRLFDTRLSERELCKIGVTVGADVPFCIVGGTLLAQGIGDVLNVLEPLPDCFLVLAKPEYGVNTKEAYAAFDREPWRFRTSDRFGMLMAMQHASLDEICPLMSNMFEQFIEVPDKVRIRSEMYKSGAKGVCMSGSGPTVFGVFVSAEEAAQCAAALKTFVKDVHICTPVKHGCQIE